MTNQAVAIRALLAHTIHEELLKSDYPYRREVSESVLDAIEAPIRSDERLRLLDLIRAKRCDTENDAHAQDQWHSPGSAHREGIIRGLWIAEQLLSDATWETP